MPNKTIYIREVDTEVWERAEKLAGSSVSARITEALRRYVYEVEMREEEAGMENIGMEVEAGMENIGMEVEELAAAVAAKIERPATWLSVKEAAVHVKKSWQEMYGLVARGDVPSYRAGGPQSIRIDVFELDAWVRTNNANSK